MSGCLADRSRQLAASDELRLSLLSRVSEFTTVAALVDLLGCDGKTGHPLHVVQKHSPRPYFVVCVSPLDLNMFYANQILLSLCSAAFLNGLLHQPQIKATYCINLSYVRKGSL